MKSFCALHGARLLPFDAKLPLQFRQEAQACARRSARAKPWPHAHDDFQLRANIASHTPARLLLSPARPGKSTGNAPVPKGFAMQPDAPRLIRIRENNICLLEDQSRRRAER